MMDPDEFLAAIKMVRRRGQAKIAIAKGWLTDEQRAIFYSKPFKGERADKPRRMLKLRDYKEGHRLGAMLEIGRPDGTYHSRVVLDQCRRLIGGDYEPKFRVVKPMKGYDWFENTRIKGRVRECEKPHNIEE